MNPSEAYIGFTFKIHSDLRVDGVEFLNTVQRVCLCLLDDLLRVVEEEQTEEDQASVDRHRVQACSEHGGGGQEHGAWRWTERRGRSVNNHVNRQVVTGDASH